MLYELGDVMNEYTLKLDDRDLGIINNALQDVALKLAAPLIQKINKQIEESKAPKVEELSE
jgi:hypothetical protein